MSQVFFCFFLVFFLRSPRPLWHLRSTTFGAGLLPGCFVKCPFPGLPFAKPTGDYAYLRGWRGLFEGFWLHRSFAFFFVVPLLNVHMSSMEPMVSAAIFSRVVRPLGAFSFSALRSSCRQTEGRVSRLKTSTFSLLRFYLKVAFLHMIFYWMAAPFFELATNVPSATTAFFSIAFVSAFFPSPGFFHFCSLHASFRSNPGRLLA